MTRARAIRVFGRTPIVDELFAGDIGAWRGPTRSGYGVHLVRVSAFEPQGLPDFESVTDQVRTAAIRARSKEATRLAMQKLRTHYNVERNHEDSP